MEMISLRRVDCESTIEEMKITNQYNCLSHLLCMYKH